MSQAWGRASIAALGHKNAATYYSANTAALAVVRLRPRHSTTPTLNCGNPDDKWGWAVLAGAEIKLDMLSPGSRIGFYGTIGQARPG